MDIFYKWINQQKNRDTHNYEMDNDIINVLLYPSEYKTVLLTMNEKSKMISGPLKITPIGIIFQKFTPGNVYNATLTISNVDKTLHCIRLVWIENPAFKIELKGSIFNIKLAPGISQSLNIQFNPDERKDYEYQLDVVVDYGTITIPIIGIGPRGILDLPDKILLPETAVKITTSKSLLIQNTGDSTANFQFLTNSSNYSIVPSNARLKETENMKLTVHFLSSSAGNFQGTIFVKYETGEMIKIDVQTTVINCSITLEKNEINIPDTFLGLPFIQSFKIYNNSDYSVKFQWMKFKDITVENEHKHKLAELYDKLIKDPETVRYVDLKHFNICHSEDHELISNRIRADELASLKQEDLLYLDSQFSLIPQEGEILPRNHTNISVHYKPNKVGAATSIAYLDCTGYDDRIPIKLFGACKGPIIKFINSIIDIGNVYLCSNHNIEVVCVNKGLIPGTVIYKPKSTDFGNSIDISSPYIREIASKEHGLFNVVFSAVKGGEFIESIEFVIEENVEPLQIFIKGRVICPVLHFEEDQLDLGITGIGFTTKHEVTLKNASSVPVTFSLNIPEDGNEPAVTYNHFNNTSVIPRFPMNPREFSLSPLHAQLDPHGSMIIKIDFTPNAIRMKKCRLKIDIEGSTFSISLPIVYISRAACFAIMPPIFYISFCFINFPYTQSFTVKNISDVEGYCYFQRKNIPDDAAMFYSMSRNYWHLKPGESRDSSITVITRAIGRQIIELNLVALGEKTVHKFSILCTGQGPVIYPTPRHLDWGRVPLLQEKSLSLMLFNKSPIPASFNTTIQSKNSPWTISPISGEIFPMKDTKITVILFLRDPQSHADKIMIKISNSFDIFVNLHAFGIGISIIIEPNICPTYNMGILFCNQDNHLHLAIKNEGNQWRKIIFSNTSEFRSSRSVLSQDLLSKKLSFEPQSVELLPRSVQNVKCIAHSKICEEISEQWWLYTICEQGKRELIGTTIVSVKFIKPSLIFNKKELHFYINHSSFPEEISEKTTEQIEITNTSELDMIIHLSTESPFKIFNEDNQEVTNSTVNLYKNIEKIIKVHFTPVLRQSQLFSRNFQGILKIKYDQQPGKHEIKCTAAINYPNIIISPKQLIFNIPVGSSEHQFVTLKNDGPISVNFNLLWITETDHHINSELISQNIELIEIVPNKGVVLPHSMQLIRFTFGASKVLCLQTQLHCDVLQGPSEYIEILARSDNIKYLLDKSEINFNSQIIFKHCRDTIILKNTCSIQFSYKLMILPGFNEENINVLLIKPTDGFIEPEETVIFEIISQSIIPGYFERSLQLEIANLSSIKIAVKTNAILPQVYISLPRILNPNNYPVHGQYYALKYSQSDTNIIKEANNTNDKRKSPLIAEIDYKQLINNGWEIIDSNTSPLARIIDIDMAVERFFILEYIKENRILLMTALSSKNSFAIPDLFTEKYKLDFGYVLIEQLTHYPLELFNYSLIKASVRLAKFEKPNYLSKFGIKIRFNEQVIMPNESFIINIYFQPSRRIRTDNYKKIKRKIYVEIANSYTIPISLTAIITTPLLKINPKILDFCEILIGDCKLMQLLLKNDGLIECNWKPILIAEKNQSNPFYLLKNSGICTPGETDIINVYFMPQKAGHQEVELSFIVDQAYEPQKIRLIGQGIEVKLKISKSFINFPATIPHSLPQEYIFLIKNTSLRPVEFYWHHLDFMSIEDDKIARVLLHYYQSNEILLPAREFGCRLPLQLYDFYQSLIDDMEYFMMNRNIKEILEENDFKETIDEDKDNNEKEEDNEQDSKSIEDLLYLYINKLHEGPNFLQIKKYPIEEILDKYDKKNNKIDDKSVDFKDNNKDSFFNKICVIFYGAPFTAYQETACKAAKKLEIPLLNLNNIITEAIALEISTSSEEIRMLIDKKYEELLKIAEELMIKVDFKAAKDNKKTDITSKNSKVKDNKYEKLKRNVLFNFPEPVDPFLELKNIPSIQILNSMDPLTFLEYKIKGINLLMKIIENRSNPDTKKKSKKVNVKEENFLGIDFGFFAEILRKELTKDHFKQGFVLQTLKNNFIKNDLASLISILNALDNAKMIVFVTFHNSIEIYEKKLTEKLNEIAMEDKVEEIFSSELKDIDKLSSSQFDLLSEEDKKLFIKEKVASSIDESEESRSKFKESVSESMDEYERPQIASSSEMKSKTSNKNRKKQSKPNTLNNAESSDTQNEVKRNKINIENNIYNANDNNEKSKVEWTTSPSIIEAFKAFKINLKAINNVINEWKPQKLFLNEKNNFDIWHVRFSDPWNSNNYELVINQLIEFLHKENPQEILHENSNLCEFQEPELKSELYTVLNTSKIKQKSITINKHFELFEIPLLENSSSNSSIEEDVVEDSIEPRVIMKPGEVKKYKIVFKPKEIGNFGDRFDLSVFDGNRQTYFIKVNAAVDIPRINMNPSTIFNEVRTTKEDINNINNPMFFSDINAYDFGSLLVMKKGISVHKKETSFKFYNPSLIDADVEILLEKKNHFYDEAFDFNPNKMLIKSKDNGVLQIFGFAPKIGVNKDRLLIKIKDNPVIEEINLLNTGCELNIELSTKKLSFGPVLLSKKKLKNITINNKSELPIFWKIIAVDSIDFQLNVSPTSGWINHYSKEEFKFCYNAQKIGFSESSVTIGFFINESNNDTDRVLSDTINITADTYDVSVEIDNTDIDFKIVKIKEVCQASFNIGNKGKYSVDFVIQLENDTKILQINKNLPKTLKKNLRIEPTSGTLLPAKNLKINLTFIPKFEIKLKKAYLLKCNILNPKKTSQIISEIPLTVSINAQYSKFKIEPQPELNFGPIKIDTVKTMSFFIRNTGNSSFQYKILSKSLKIADNTFEQSHELIEDKKFVRKVSKSKMNRKESKLNKSSTNKSESLQVGHFDITKTAGALNADETAEIFINFHCEEIGNFKTEIYLLISNCSPEDKNGKILNLTADSCIPHINFNNLDYIFQQNHITDYIENFVCPSESGAHTIFCKSEMCLYFQGVIVSTTKTAELKFYNSSLVPVNVSINLQSDAINSEDSLLQTFRIEPVKEFISVLSSKTFTVYFTPSLIDIFTGSLQASIDLPSYINNTEKLSIKLRGEGCVGEIELIEPEMFYKRGHAMLEFTKCLIDIIHIKNLIFKNSGKIKINITIEIIEDIHQLFCLHLADEHKKHELMEKNFVKVENRCININVEPEEVQKLFVTFKPIKIGKFEAHMRLSTVENPYDVLMINLTGESFMESLVLEGLPLSEVSKPLINTGNSLDINDSYQVKKLKENKTLSGPNNATDTVCLTYILNCGVSFINEEKKVLFKIVNMSDKYFRFEFSLHEYLIFTPRTGHLNYHDFKNITATFVADQPISYKEAPVNCTICEIKLLNDNKNEIAWDDQHTRTKWVSLESVLTFEDSEDTNKENLVQKIIEKVEESNYEEIPDTIRIIQLLFYGTVDHSVYSCDIKELNFEDTFIYQSREKHFELKNSGLVNLVYLWVLKDVNKLNSASPNSGSQYKLPVENIEYIDEFNSQSDSIEFNSQVNLSDMDKESSEIDTRIFQINPEAGIIFPGQTVTCIVRFSPDKLTVYHCKLICQIDNIDPEISSLTISITGKGLLPIYHFDIASSDYLTAKRRDLIIVKTPNCNYLPNIPRDINVIEFIVTGVEKSYTKHFDLINPTTNSYNFSWINKTRQNTEDCFYFHCKNPDDIAEHGKRTKISFTFLSQDCGVFETLWSMFIEKHKLKIPFLLVGIVSDPHVVCCTPKIVMKATLGIRAHDVMIIRNNEKFSISFKMMENTMFSEGKLQTLIVEPMNGILKPFNDQEFTITLNPTKIGDFEFTPHCKINKMKNPLKIFITANIYKIMPHITYKNMDDKTIEIKGNEKNIIELGKLMPNEPITINFKLSNLGELTFNYKWDLEQYLPFIDNSYYYKLEMEETSGKIDKKSTVISSLKITATKKVDLKNRLIQLKVDNGPTYELLLNASAKRPLVEFNISKYNFGLCYVSETSPVRNIDLKITNNDSEFVIIECTFKNLPHLSVDLQNISQALSSKKSVLIPINFKPLQCINYEETLIFLINSAIKKKITIKGEGIPYKIHLLKPQDKFINLGSTSLNKMTQKKITIINSGRATVKLRLDLIKNLNKHGNEADYTNLFKALTFEPSEPVIIYPNRTQDVYIQFISDHRIEFFEEQIAAITNATIIPLSRIRGKCIGPEFYLNRTHLSFDSIVEGYSAQDKVILHNSGDISAHFKWKTQKLDPSFSIRPLQGLSLPKTKMVFIVSFHPMKESKLIQAEVTIEIENYSSFTLFLRGGCLSFPDPVEIIIFSTPVRIKQIKTIDIANEVDFDDDIKIIVNGDYFNLSDNTESVVKIPSKSSTSCEIIYYPLIMNEENNPHTGKIIIEFIVRKFVKVYNLEGRSLSPEAIDKLFREIPVTIKYLEILKVYNWLEKPQTFECKIELISDYKDKPAYNFTGKPTIDILGKSVRNYEALLCCYNESILNFRIIFTNSQGEYQFYEVQYKVTTPDVIETIELNTTAQEPVFHSLQIDNPYMDQDISYSVTCDHSEITIQSDSYNIPPQKSNLVTIKYHPVKASESETDLKIISSKLGVLLYKLKLSAKSPVEKIYKLSPVSTTFGSSSIFFITIYNNSAETDTFKITIDEPSFICHSNEISIFPESEQKIKIIYEPCNIDVVEATLTASSNFEKKFIYLMTGNCYPPKPKGPFTLTPQKPLIIPFKNIFLEPKTFKYILDPTVSFITLSSSNLINSKQTANIIVNFQDTNNSTEESLTDIKQSVTGKLVIYCTDPELSSINWTYYLKGIFE